MSYLSDNRRRAIHEPIIDRYINSRIGSSGCCPSSQHGNQTVSAHSAGIGSLLLAEVGVGLARAVFAVVAALDGPVWAGLVGGMAFAA